MNSCFYPREWQNFWQAIKLFLARKDLGKMIFIHCQWVCELICGKILLKKLLKINEKISLPFCCFKHIWFSLPLSSSFFSSLLFSHTLFFSLHLSFFSCSTSENISNRNTFTEEKLQTFLSNIWQNLNHNLNTNNTMEYDAAIFKMIWSCNTQFCITPTIYFCLGKDAEK